VSRELVPIYCPECGKQDEYLITVEDDQREDFSRSFFCTCGKHFDVVFFLVSGCWTTFYSNGQGKEMVNHPDHYKGKKFEVIDIIEDYNLNFSLGNAIKYILRADKKGKRTEDLKKAIFYINREIENDSRS
jgi:hypothetical protein